MPDTTQAITHDIPLVASNFSLPGEFVKFGPCGQGLINDTYEVNYDQGGVELRYVIQRINHNVFKQPELVMDNIIRVTKHITKKLKAVGETEVARRVLTLVPTRSGKLWHKDKDGNTWRCYVFVEGAEAHSHVDSPALAEEAARAFGKFQTMLVDLQGPRLADTIPNFHHTRSRYNALLQAIEDDAAGRVKSVQAELDWIREREWIVDELLNLQSEGVLPERITHNDTKINNVMMDRHTGEGICVMDLDTVMPGLVLYDFGDLVRATTISTAEDSLELDKVAMRMSMFEALVKGYLDSAGAFLTDKEVEYLAFSGKLITLETGIRFLTDHLNGDRYFKIKRPNHNLDRFRVQSRLVESIEQQEEAMRLVVAKHRHHGETGAGTKA
jgi:Ser/Thr protein kinase RdoA (MazF antagonist)